MTYHNTDLPLTDARIMGELERRGWVVLRGTQIDEETGAYEGVWTAGRERRHPLYAAPTLLGLLERVRGAAVR